MLPLAGMGVSFCSDGLKSTGRTEDMEKTERESMKGSGVCGLYSY